MLYEPYYYYKLENIITQQLENEFGICLTASYFFLLHLQTK